MKYLTKEQVQIAIDKVEAQGRLLISGYISRDGQYRDVIGYLLTNEQLAIILKNNANHLPIGVIGTHLFGTEPEPILGALQFINDTSTTMEEFKKRTAKLIAEAYE